MHCARALTQGCIKLRHVAQTFQSAGRRNFPVPSTTAHSQKGDQKVALTSRLENLLYTELDAALRVDARRPL